MRTSLYGIWRGGSIDDHSAVCESSSSSNKFWYTWKSGLNGGRIVPCHLIITLALAPESDTDYQVK